MLGVVSYSLGEVVSAHAHHEQALALDPRQRHLGVVYGEADRRVTGSALHANVLWVLGYPDQALTQSRAALTLRSGDGSLFYYGCCLVP